MTRRVLIAILIFIALPPLLLFMGCQPKELTSAKIYINNGDWDKATEQLELAVETYPDNAEAHFMLGKAYGVQGLFAKMVEQFNRSLALSRKFAKEIKAERERYWIQKYNQGITAQGKKDYAEAERLLDQAAQIDPQKQETYVQIALTYLSAGQNDKAISMYRSLLEKDPGNVELLTALGNLYYSQKMYPDAIALLKRILAIEPDNRDALANLALSYDSMGQTEAAFKAYQAAIAANPTDKDLIFLLGVHYYKQTKFTKAIELFQRVLELDPNDFESVSNIGNAYLSLAETFRKKLKNSSHSESTTMEEIKTLRANALANYRQAIPYLKKAVELQPQHPSLWRNLGVAYINSGDKERGEQAFLKSEKIAIDPHSKAR